MPVSWNASMDQKLLLAVLAVVRLDSNAVARKWSEIFGNDNGNNPTQRAITEHISKLKKDLGIGGTSASTPKRSPVKKQRTSSVSYFKDEAADDGSHKNSPSKRSRMDISDDEASEVEALPTSQKADDEFAGPVCCQVAGDPIPTRQLPSRRAKLDRKPVIVDETTDESELDEGGSESEEEEPTTPASSAPDPEDSKMANEQIVNEMKSPEPMFDEIVVGGPVVAE